MYILLNNAASDSANLVSVDRIGFVSLADPLNCAVEAALTEAALVEAEAVEAAVEAELEAVVEAELEAVTENAAEEAVDVEDTEAAENEAAAALANEQAEQEEQAMFMAAAADYGADDVDLVGEYFADLAANMGGTIVIP